MLDLPHYHCNNIYVPWLSKDIEIYKARPSKDLSGSPLRNNTIKVDELDDLRVDPAILNHFPDSGMILHRADSVEPDPHANSVLSPTRQFMSPISQVGCDGWCGYDLIPRATVVSIGSPAWCE
jgi:hypothetical protein